MTTDLIARLEDALPQTQCRQCGFTGCTEYAHAIAAGTPINRCPPGGAAGIRALAAVTGRPELPLDPEYGTEAPFAVARIDAARCIGCRRCVRVCPTDALTGAPKHLFAVIDAYCTGCALCIPACPMDCITMQDSDHVWDHDDARRARRRFDAKKARLAAQNDAIYRRSASDAKSAVMTNLSALLAERHQKVRQ